METQRQPSAKQTKHSSQERKPQPAVSAPTLAVSSLDFQVALGNPLSARPETILRLQRMAGNRAVANLIQRKVVVGPAHDHYEQEADRVAQQVMSAPVAAPLQRAPDDEEEIQTKPLAVSIRPLVQRQGANETVYADRVRQLDIEKMIVKFGQMESGAKKAHEYIKKQNSGSDKDTNWKSLTAFSKEDTAFEKLSENFKVVADCYYRIEQAVKKSSLNNINAEIACLKQALVPLKHWQGVYRALRSAATAGKEASPLIGGSDMALRWIQSNEYCPEFMRAIELLSKMVSFLETGRVDNSNPIDFAVDPGSIFKPNGEGDALDAFMAQQLGVQQPASPASSGRRAKQSDASQPQEQESSPLARWVPDRHRVAEQQPDSKVTPEGDSLDAFMTQRKPASPGAGFEVGADFEQRLSAQQSGGQPLPGDTRDFMESRFGADFSEVRVHTDGESAELNREVQAQAFTHGQDIFMGEGKYSPETDSGKQLLAHELTHTIQQGGAQPAAQRAIQRSGVSKAQKAELKEREEQLKKALKPNRFARLSSQYFLSRPDLVKMIIAEAETIDKMPDAEFDALAKNADMEKRIREMHQEGRGWFGGKTRLGKATGWLTSSWVGSPTETADVTAASLDLGNVGGVASAVGGMKDALEGAKQMVEGEKREGAVKLASGMGGFASAGSTLLSATGHIASATASTVAGGADLVTGGIKGVQGGYKMWQAGFDASALKHPRLPTLGQVADKLATIARYKRNMAGWEATAGGLGAMAGGAALATPAMPAAAPVALGAGLASKVLGADTTWKALSAASKVTSKVTGEVWTNDEYQDKIKSLDDGLVNQAKDVLTELAESRDFALARDKSKLLHEAAAQLAPGLAKKLEQELPAVVNTVGDKLKYSQNGKKALEQRLKR